MNSSIATRKYKNNLQNILSHVLGTEIDSLENITKGNNSLVYIVRCSSNKTYVSKFYFFRKTDTLSRLTTEFDSLKFLWEQQVRCIPKTVLYNKEYGCGIFEWIQGTYFPPQKIRKQEIDQLVDFLLRLHQVSRLPISKKINPASENCFSVDSIVKTIEQRLIKLYLCSDPVLKNYLKHDIETFFSRTLTWCKQKSGLLNVDWKEEIPINERTLSPSDLGFHNSIMRNDGKIIFFDFEYFGWDDPSKMISDFLLHPGFSLSFKLKKYFIRRILQSLPSNKRINNRIQITYPLHAINWCLRMLNSFLLEYQSSNQIMLEKSPELVQIEKDQGIKNSKILFNKISNEYEFPF